MHIYIYIHHHGHVNDYDLPPNTTFQCNPPQKNARNQGFGHRFRSKIQHPSLDPSVSETWKNFTQVGCPKSLGNPVSGIRLGSGLSTDREVWDKRSGHHFGKSVGCAARAGFQ